MTGGSPTRGWEDAAAGHVVIATFDAIMEAQDDARSRYNALPCDLEGSDPARFEREEQLLHAALAAADRAVPTDGPQFLRLLTHMADSCSIDDDNAQHLLAQARSLWGADRSAWNDVSARYDAALATETAYDDEHIKPVVPPDLPPGAERNVACDRVPAAVWAESQRLLDIRCDIEDELLALPSPDLTAFARKVIICRAEERDLNGLDDALVAEAREFLAGDKA